MMDRLIIQTRRENYGKEDVKTMTVGELKEFLDQFDEDMPVVLSFDNGYTFGGVREQMFEEDFDMPEEDEDYE